MGLLIFRKNHVKNQVKTTHAHGFRASPIVVRGQDKVKVLAKRLDWHSNLFPFPPPFSLPLTIRHTKVHLDPAQRFDSCSSYYTNSYITSDMLSALLHYKKFLYFYKAC